MRRVKAVARESKKEMEDKFGMKLSHNFDGNRSCFGKK